MDEEIKKDLSGMVAAKIMAANLLTLMELSFSAPAQGETHRDMAKRMEKTMKKRSSEMADSIMDDIEKLFTTQKQVEAITG